MQRCRSPRDIFRVDELCVTDRIVNAAVTPTIRLQFDRATTIRRPTLRA